MFPTDYQQEIRVVKYWLKLNNLTANSMLKAVYNMLYNECESGNTNWVSKIRDVLNVTGFNFVWLYPQSVVTNVFVPLLKQRLKDTFITEWRRGIETSPC